MNQQASSSKGWVVTFAALSVNLVLGALYAWSVMGKALVAQWGWTKTQASLPFTASTIAFSLMMTIAGRMQDKTGPRMIAILGGVMLGLGMILSAFVKTPMAMILTFGVIGGIGIGLGYSATTPPALKWFPPARKGLIAGIVVSGIGLSPVYMSPLTQWLLGKTGSIPNTFIALGVGSIVTVAILANLLTNPPAGYVAAGAAPAGGPAQAAAPRREVDYTEMLATPQFWMLWIILALTASAGLMVIAHLATIAKLQAKIEWGFMAVVILSIFNTSGRLVGGFFSDKIGRSNTMVLFFVLQAINMFYFKNYTTANMLLFGAAFTGLCYGTIFPLFPATTADFYGIRNLGVNYGFVFTAFGVAGTLGPIMAGKIVDNTGSYKLAYLICAGMLIAGAVLALMLRAPKVAAVAAPAPAPQREMANR